MFDVNGKWSDDNSVGVTHSQRDPMPNVARNTSGDAGYVLIFYGQRVGVMGYV